MALKTRVLASEVQQLGELSQRQEFVGSHTNLVVGVVVGVVGQEFDGSHRAAGANYRMVALPSPLPLCRAACRGRWPSLRCIGMSAKNQTGKQLPKDRRRSHHREDPQRPSSEVLQYSVSCARAFGCGSGRRAGIIVYSVVHVYLLRFAATSRRPDSAPFRKWVDVWRFREGWQESVRRRDVKSNFYRCKTGRKGGESRASTPWP